MTIASEGHHGLGTLRSIPTVPATEFLNWRPDQGADRPRHATPPVNDEQGLTDVELRFLQAVLEHPGEPSSAYAGYAGVGARKATQARKRLVEQGCLREHRVNTAARGRAAIVLELCPSAHEALRTAVGKSGVKP